MATARQQLGQRGEELAEKWLNERGISTLVRNYRCPYGEVDRVMQEGDTFIFVEVKARRNSDYGTPAESVTPFKQRQITRTAMHYLQESHLEDATCRFDVVEVFFEDGSLPRVQHFPGVFEAVSWDE
jgi:putative endonuclease